MSDAARPIATYEDVLAAPEHMVAQILGGELHLHPRPAVAHAAATHALNDELSFPFKRGRGGPGGWWFLFEPELHLGGNILVPDLAGWRRTTMDHLPQTAYIEIRPDWVCEVLSPYTEKVDRTLKLPIYVQQGVGHVWLVDPQRRTLEVLRRAGEDWATVGRFADDALVRAEPFDAIELPLSVLWADVR